MSSFLTGAAVAVVLAACSYLAMQTLSLGSAEATEDRSVILHAGE